mgnify:FL=1
MGMKLFIASLAVIGVLLGGFAWYYKNTQARITTLVENAAKLESVTKTQEATITQLQESAQEQAALTQELSGKLAQAEKENRKIATMLANTDIVKNSIANPKAVEEKINAEVTNFFSDLKSVTTTQ